MPPNPDCQTCQGTNKVIVPDGRKKTSIGFVDYTAEVACPRCTRPIPPSDKTPIIADVSSSHIEDRLARIERHLGLSIGDVD